MARRFIRGLVAIASCALSMAALTACGASSDTPIVVAGAGGSPEAAPPDTGVGGSGGSDAGQAGAAGAAGQAQDGGDAAAGNTAPVTASVAQFNDTGGATLWQAAFLTLFQSDPSKRCYRRVVDNCFVIDCRPSKYGSTPAPWVSVGPLTFSSANTTDVVLELGPGSVYKTKNGNALKWMPGDTIKVSAPGAELPAFEAEVVMTTPLTVLSPDMNMDAGHIPIDSTQAYKVTWEPTDQQVVIEILESESGTVATTAVDFLDLGCVFPGSAGTGEIPAALMSELEWGQPVMATCATHIQIVTQPLGDRSVETGAGNGICRNAVIQ
jgi:hypothetical protein